MKKQEQPVPPVASSAQSASESLTFPILGMTCASCQHHVEQALRSTPGVVQARVDLMAHRATVAFDPRIASPQSLVDAVHSAGYDAVLPRASDAGYVAADPDSTPYLALKAVITLIAGAVAMLLSMPIAGPMHSPMGSIDRALMGWLPWLYALPAGFVRWSLLALTSVLIVWAGRGIYISALRALRHGATNMNTLVGLGTAVAFAYSAWSTLFPAAGGQIYYDAVLLILGFLLLGKALESRARRRALSAIVNLAQLRPITARRILDGVEALVPLDEIRQGDKVLVLPGERFPVDGEILEGRTTVDESMLTGESTPLDRVPGGRTLAGSLNYDGAVVCLVQSIGSSTVLEQIAAMVEQAQSSRAPMQRLADRASAVFVPVVLALGVITFAVWLLAAHSFSQAIAASVAVLVAACPCAMGLAVPAALTVAVGRGAQLGVLFKGGEALERLAHLDAIALDKTGTLTLGRPVLESIHVFAACPGGRFSESLIPDESDLLRLAAAAEERSNHPLARAIVEAAKSRALAWAAASGVQVLPGRGVSAQVEGMNCLLGNEALFREHAIPLPECTSSASSGATRLWMALDGAAVGYFEVRDALRPDAVHAVEALRRDGYRLIMLTGDSSAAAAPIAAALGIRDVEADLDPAGKLARIRALQRQGLRVAMVGDGINDAASMAQADAAIAMGSGADLAQEAGDVLLLRATPAAIPAALDLSRQAVRIMRQNLGWAVGYNLLGLPLAAGVFYPAFHILLSPWLAAAAMALSSVCVLLNSLRLRRWRAAVATD